MFSSFVDLYRALDKREYLMIIFVEPTWGKARHS